MEQQTEELDLGAEAVGLLEQRRQRKGELRESILALDGELGELSRAAAVFFADGEGVDEGVPEALQSRRSKVREELSDLHGALAHMDSLIAGAEEDLREIQLEEARGLYLEARRREEKAAAKLARVVERNLLPALEGLKEAGVEAYSLGLSAETETPATHRRRSMVLENYVATKLGEPFPLFRVHRRLQVEDLESRLNEVLPAIGTDDGRGEG